MDVPVDFYAAYSPISACALIHVLCGLYSGQGVYVYKYIQLVADFIGGAPVTLRSKLTSLTFTLDPTF